MKELSIEEKAKAYDEAIEKLRNFYRDYDTVSRLIDVKEELANLFPELKESKDERIRNFLIMIIDKYAGISNEEKKKCLTWLENHGAQKPDDKIEPKFKIGDWVAINPELHLASPLYIKYVDNNNYRVESANGTSGIPTINYLDRYYHLWTIEDAKDGDILASYNDENPFIFKGCIDTAHPNAPVAYCGIDNSNKFYNCINTSSWWTRSLVHPAEKVQRYFLFQKMKESGYEWDAEKKELKKIKQKSDWSKEDEEMLEDVRFNFIYNKEKLTDALIAQYNRFFDKIKSLKPQPKQEWNEEDSKRLQRIIDFLWYNRKGDPDTIYQQEQDIEWLKSLRPQNTTTEEELTQAKKDAYNDALDKIEYHSGKPTFDDGWSAAIWYLKKRNAQPQDNWRPSDEQMKALGIAIRCGIQLGTWEEDALKSLKEQLMRLRKNSYDNRRAIGNTSKS